MPESDAVPLRVLVVDDEMPGRRRLLDLLAQETGVEVVGAVGRGRDAVERITTDPPDVVFLDVQMRDLTGIEVVRAVGPDRMPVTVFVTAYDRYAVEAFDLAAIDYILKPFDDARFRRALARARDAVQHRDGALARAQFAALLGESAAPAAPEPDGSAYLETITVKTHRDIRVVAVDQIDYVVADGPYAEIHAAGERLLIREQMQALEVQLDPAVFFRAHRSTILRLERVKALRANEHGDYTAVMADSTHLRVSRSRRAALVEALRRAVRG